MLLTTVALPICYKCKHLFGENLSMLTDEGTLCCKAFPMGIPRRYFFGEDDGAERPEHREVVSGQNGDFVYSPID